MMDCNQARLLLEFDRPGATELAPGDAEALRQHLGECPDCGPLAESERRLDAQLGQAMRDVPVPAGLRERLLKRLGAERDAWYRGWLVRGIGAAAAIAFLVWMAQLWWFHRLPAVDGKIVHGQRSNMVGATPEDVEHGFRELGVATRVPRDFDYALLDSYDLVQFQGEQVPHLLFFAPGRGALAHVYVLSSRQFDLQGTLKNGAHVGSGQRTLRILKNAMPDYLYVVIHTGEDLNPFQKGGGAIQQ